MWLRELSIPVARVLMSHEASPAEMRERKRQKEKGEKVSEGERVGVREKERKKSKKKRVIERRVDEREGGKAADQGSWICSVTNHLMHNTVIKPFK